MFWVVLLLLIIGGISNAIMDVLRFRYNTSIFSDFKNQQWWNPSISWRNKWKNGEPENGEKFWGSSRWFVRFTDAWHFFQGIMFTSFFTVIVIYSTYINIYVDFILMYLIFTSTFEIFFKYILKKQ